MVPKSIDYNSTSVITHKSTQWDEPSTAAAPPPPIPWHDHIQTHMSNISCCYIAFFLIAWVAASVAHLLSNRRRSPDLVFAVVVFFAFQAVGALFFGVILDVKGRSRTLTFILGFLSLGLIVAGIFVLSPQEQKHFYPLTNQTLYQKNQLNDGRVHKKIVQSQSASGIPELWSRNYWVWIGSISCIGTATGGLYPTIGSMAIESVIGTNRHLVLGGLFSMQGVAHVLLKTFIAMILRIVPNCSIGTVFFYLMGLACFISFSLCIIGYFLCEETIPYIKSRHLLSTQRASVEMEPAFSELETSYSTVSRPPLEECLLPSLNRIQTSNTPDLTMSTTNSVCSRYVNKKKDLPLLTYSKYYRIFFRYATVFYWDIIGSGIPWCIFDFSFYGYGVFHFLLVERVKGFESDSQENYFQLLVSIVCLFGYYLSLIVITHVSLKLSQILGFVILAFVYFGLALSLYSISHTPQTLRHTGGGISQYLGASLLYDCVFRFFNFIPNLTCFLLPLEAFPTRVRGVFYGLAVCISRLGILAGLLLSWEGLNIRFNRASMLSFYCLTSLLGAFTTRAISPHIRSPSEDVLKLDVLYLLRFGKQQHIVPNDQKLYYRTQTATTSQDEKQSLCRHLRRITVDTVSD